MYDALRSLASNLKRGERSRAVLDLQSLLAEFGYLSPADIDSVTMNFGPLTQQKVAMFQQHAGLSASPPGTLDTATRQALLAIEDVLEMGNIDTVVVTALQKRLVALGKLDQAAAFADPSAWGHFGRRTANAVSSFQQSANLAPSGRVGPTTFGALFGVRSAVPAGKEAQPSVTAGARSGEVCWPVLPLKLFDNWGGGGFPDNNAAYAAYVAATGMVHTGQDFNGVGGGSSDFGAAIYVVADGTVTQVAYGLKGWGKVVLIHHPQLGVWSMYAHMSKVDMAMKAGAAVRTGQKLGTIGDGDGAWPYAHLHFEIRRKALRIDNGFYPHTKDSTNKTAQQMRQKVLADYANPRQFLTMHNARQTLPKG